MEGTAHSYVASSGTLGWFHPFSLPEENLRTNRSLFSVSLVWISDGYSDLKRCDLSAACNKKKRKSKVALVLLF